MAGGRADVDRQASPRPLWCLRRPIPVPGTGSPGTAWSRVRRAGRTRNHTTFTSAHRRLTLVDLGEKPCFDLSRRRRGPSGRRAQPCPPRRSSGRVRPIMRGFPFPGELTGPVGRVSPLQKMSGGNRKGDRSTRPLGSVEDPMRTRSVRLRSSLPTGAGRRTTRNSFPQPPATGLLLPRMRRESLSPFGDLSRLVSVVAVLLVPGRSAHASSKFQCPRQ